MLEICIVDDSEPIRERLVALASPLAGVRSITCAGSLAQAEALFRKELPDVVILDIRLPDGSGISLLEDLMKRNRPPKVIVFTGYAYPQYKTRCLDLGAYRFLEKSSEFQKIPGIIAEILEGQQRDPVATGDRATEERSQ